MNAARRACLLAVYVLPSTQPTARKLGTVGMHAKLERLTRLMNEGYDLLDIRSDSVRIEARLARDGSRVSVEFDRADAHEILFEERSAARAFARRARVGRALR